MFLSHTTTNWLHINLYVICITHYSNIKFFSIHNSSNFVYTNHARWLLHIPAWNFWHLKCATFLNNVWLKWYSCTKTIQKRHNKTIHKKVIMTIIVMLATHRNHSWLLNLSYVATLSNNSRNFPQNIVYLVTSDPLFSKECLITQSIFIHAHKLQIVSEYVNRRTYIYISLNFLSLKSYFV